MRKITFLLFVTLGWLQTNGQTKTEGFASKDPNRTKEDIFNLYDKQSPKSDSILELYANIANEWLRNHESKNSVTSENFRSLIDSMRFVSGDYLIDVLHVTTYTNYYLKGDTIKSLPGTKVKRTDSFGLWNWADWGVKDLIILKKDCTNGAKGDYPAIKTKTKSLAKTSTKRIYKPIQNNQNDSIVLAPKLNLNKNLSFIPDSLIQILRNGGNVIIISGSFNNNNNGCCGGQNQNQNQSQGNVNNGYQQNEVAHPTYHNYDYHVEFIDYSSQPMYAYYMGNRTPFYFDLSVNLWYFSQNNRRIYPNYGYINYRDPLPQLPRGFCYGPQWAQPNKGSYTGGPQGGYTNPNNGSPQSGYTNRHK